MILSIPIAMCLKQLVSGARLQHYMAIRINKFLHHYIYVFSVNCSYYLEVLTTAWETCLCCDICFLFFQQTLLVSD